MNQPLCKWGKNSWERNSWANVSWKNSSIVWACDIVAYHKVIHPVLHDFGLTSPKPCKGTVIDVRGFDQFCCRYLGPLGQQAFRWNVWVRKRLCSLFLPCQSLMCAICPLWHKLITMAKELILFKWKPYHKGLDLSRSWLNHSFPHVRHSCVLTRCCWLLGCLERR